MARIVLGLATSHSPMLSTPPDQWTLRVAADRSNPAHPFRGRCYAFDELAALRKDEQISDKISRDIWHEKHAACQRRLVQLARIFAETAADAAVIIGDDQYELFLADNMPAFCVYWGETVDNIPRTANQAAHLPPGIGIADPGHCPPQRTTYPCLSELGRHMIESLIGEEFDVAQSNKLPSGSDWNSGIPHAYGFIYRQIMQDKVIPHVPVMINTFFPPNQPSVARCYAFGEAIRRAVESWNSAKTVVIIASGGLSHFVIDEALDRQILDALIANDKDSLIKLPEDRFQSGTSEIKNWVSIAAAMAGTGLKMELVDYIPCYRSEAGTGNAMGFAYWQ